MIVINPSQKVYNTLISKYTLAFDKLMAMLPKNPIDQDDDFMDFISNRDY